MHQKRNDGIARNALKMLVGTQRHKLRYKEHFASQPVDIALSSYFVSKSIYSS